MVRTGIPRIIVPCLALALVAVAAPPPHAAGPLNSYIVQVTPGADPVQIGRGVAQRTGGKLGHVYTKALSGFSVQLPPGLAKKAIEGQPGVLKVEPDARIHAVAQTLPTGINRVDADLNNIAQIDTSDERVDVDIAILDTGIDRDHPDLNVVGGRRFYSFLWFTFEDDQYDDDNGHGTHCAGIAAALDNDIGVVGMAPGARLWAVKILDSNGSGYVSDLVAGVDWVTAHGGIEVANMSLSAVARVDALRTAIQSAVAEGVVFVAAAGNSATDVYGSDGTFNTSDDHIPAAYPEVAAVSAMADSDGLPGELGSATTYGEDDSFASFSNYSRSIVADNPVTSPGKAIDLLMPGVNINSCWMGGGYRPASGTSMASPHAAGLAALYIAEHGAASSASGVHEIRQALINAAVEQGDATRGLVTQNDPDGNREKIGWAASAQAEPFTDIAVTDVQAPGSIVQGTIASIEVTVQNVGNQDVAESFTVELRDGTAGPIIDSQEVTGLAAGASATLTHTWDTTGSSLDGHTLVAEHHVADDNATNNSADTSTTVVEALIDIAITAVSGPDSVVQGNTANILVTVENVGNQDVAEDIPVTLEDTTDGPTIGTETIGGGLAVGASTTLEFLWDTSAATSGGHTLTATHDFGDDDTGNDLGSTTVTVAEQGAAEETVNVSVAVTRWFSFRRGWKAAATVIVTDDDGLVLYATVEGVWSGVYNAAVTGSTDNSGLELFITKAIRTSGEVVFTVTSITGSDGQVYKLNPDPPQDSYSGP